MNRRPRVLLLSPWPPYPLDGGSKRIHSLCSLLRDRFSFGLVTFQPEDLKSPLEVARSLEAEDRFLRPVFDRVFWFRRDPAAPSSVGVLRLPDDIRRHYSPGLAEALPALARYWGAELVHAEYDLMALYGRALPGLPSVLTQHDAGTVSLTRSYFREMTRSRGAQRRRLWRRRVSFEKRAMGWFDRVIAMTPADREVLARIIPRERLRVVPTGVDVAAFAPRPRRRAAGGPTVAFVGHYPHYPNEDAVLFFGRKVLPLLRKRRPDVGFLVVGSSPTPAVRRLAEEVAGVEVTGTVADVRPYLARAAVFVASVRLGRGIKGKILEAMAMGLPVVASSRAAEGLAVTPGKELLTADTAAAFAAQIERLLASPGLSARLGASARRAAVERYDWSPLADRLAAVYSELLTRS